MCRTLETLPADLGEALAAAQESDFIRRVLPAETLADYIAVKQHEWELVRKSSDADRMENDLYFVRY